MIVEDRKVPLELIPYLGETIKWLDCDNGAWGFYLPDGTGHGPVVELIKYFDNWVKLCKYRRVVIQAGGNQGLYPKMYSKFFDTVYTFEPDIVSYNILKQNINENNVIHSNKGLSSTTGTAHLLITTARNNNGTHKIVNIEDNYRESDTVTIETVTIDSLNLDIVDLIHLDVEGHENFVLDGAMDTISRCRPVIISETNSPQSYLEKFGYTCKGRFHDYIFQVS